jgi:hypothetical protein
VTPEARLIRDLTAIGAGKFGWCQWCHACILGYDVQHTERCAFRRALVYLTSATGTQTGGGRHRQQRQPNRDQLGLPLEV